MKKIAQYFCLTLGLTSLGFADSLPNIDMKPSEQQNEYVRFGMSALPVTKAEKPDKTHYELAPTVTLGSKKMYEHYGFDVGASFTYDCFNAHKQSPYSYTLPQVLFLRNFNPYKNDSLFMGVGGAFAGIKDARKNFTGLAAMATIGYHAQNARLPTNIQIECLQPALSLQYGSVKNMITQPVVQASFGLNF